jgi:hypothetical protein
MMAEPFIAADRGKGYEYATVRAPQNGGWKESQHPVYLGRVINLKEGGFRRKARGEFFFSLEKGRSYPPATPEDTIRIAKARGGSLLGSVYRVRVSLERTGSLNLFRETETSRPDTLLALLTRGLLDNFDDSRASAFMERTYTSILHPKADPTSQGVGGRLEKLGQDAAGMDFHRRYIAMTRPDKQSVGVLIDGAGPPNDVNSPITAISDHGGGPINEIRLIYAFDVMGRRV